MLTVLGLGFKQVLSVLDALLVLGLLVFGGVEDPRSWLTLKQAGI